MNNLLLTSLLFCTATTHVTSTSAQGYAYEGCATAGISAIQTPLALVGAPDGSIYVAGPFHTGTFSIGTATASTNASSAVFLARFTAELDVEWLITLAENLSTTSFTPTVTIDSDEQGNMILGIGFQDTLQVLGNELIPTDGSGIALLKLDATGNLLWVQQIDGNLLGKNGCDIDPEGNILVTGEATDELFTAKYSPDGELLWWTTASGAPSPGTQWMVRSDALGNVYTLGVLSGSGNAQFGSLMVNFPGVYYNVSYLTKYTPSGNAEWVRYVYSQTFAQFTVFNSLN